jgi:hypothetical protein
MLEHLQNQLHIQLINIHDLKHAVKMYDHNLSHEVSGNNDAAFSENMSSLHENLHNNYESLETTLSDLRSDFDHFVTMVH